MKKVVIITHNFPPIICGVGDYSYNLAKQFILNNHTVIVVCGDHNIAAKTKISDGFECKAIVPNWRRTGIGVLKKYLKLEKPDLVLFNYVPYSFHINGLPFHLLSLFVHLKKEKYLSLVFFHEISIRRNTFLNYIISVCQTYIANHILKEVNYGVTSIDFYKLFFKKNLICKIDLIPIGTNIFKHNFSKSELCLFKNELNIKESTVIISFGIRNIEPFIRAFEKLYESNKKICWIICGKNHLTDQQRKLQYIIETGYLDEEEISKYFQISDIYFALDNVTELGEGGICNKSTSVAAAVMHDLPIIGLKGDMTNREMLAVGNYILNHIEEFDKELIDTILLQKDKKITDRNDYLAWPLIYSKYKNILKW